LKILVCHRLSYQREIYVLNEHTSINQYQSITKSTKCMAVIGMTVIIIIILIVKIIVEWRVVKSKWDSQWQFISLQSIHLIHYNSTQYPNYLTLSVSLILAFLFSIRYFTTFKCPPLAANIKGVLPSWIWNITMTSYVIQ
jgi:hypothetical protein